MGKLTPGERVHNWVAAFMQLWPAWLVVLGALGYTNTDEIKGFIFTKDNTAITTLTPFEAHVRDEIERIDLEEATGRAETNTRLDGIEAALKKQDRTNYQALAKRLKQMQQRMDENHGAQ